MRHVYVIGVIALARTRVPAGENSPTVSPPSISLYRTDLSFNVRPFLTSFSYYRRDFRATSLRNDYFLLLFFFLSFETKRCYRNGMEIDRSVAREERNETIRGKTREIRRGRNVIIGVKIMGEVGDGLRRARFAPGSPFSFRFPFRAAVICPMLPSSLPRGQHFFSPPRPFLHFLHARVRISYGK